MCFETKQSVTSLKLNWADGKILHGMPSSSKTINKKISKVKGSQLSTRANMMMSSVKSLDMHLRTTAVNHNTHTHILREDLGSTLPLSLFVEHELVG